MKRAAARAVLGRYLNADTWGAFTQEPPTLFHGVPGLRYALCHSNTLPEGILLPLEERLGEAMGLLDLDTIPQTHWSECFLLGRRGARWAMARSQAPLGARLPPDKAYGFDGFVNDSPLLFAWVQGQRAGVPVDLPSRRAWATFVAEEQSALGAALQGGDPLLLGFAHGVAGALFSALLLWGLSPSDAPVKEDALKAHLSWLKDQAQPQGGALYWPAWRGGKVGPGSRLVGSLCNGCVGHGILFLEAAHIFQSAEFLDVALGALRGLDDEGELSLSFCCGQGGKATLVSRFLRLGHGSLIKESIGTWERLLGRIPKEAVAAPLSAISGLGSLLPTLSAEGPEDPILDFFIPAPVEL